MECGRILEERPGCNHFQRLGIPAAAELDRDTLEARYLKLSRLLHPDFQAQAGPDVQHLALTNSALLNDAWTILTDDLRLAEYLLGLQDPEALDRGEIESRRDRIARELTRDTLQVDDLATLIHELRVYRRILRDTGVPT